MLRSLALVTIRRQKISATAILRAGLRQQYKRFSCSTVLSVKTKRRNQDSMSDATTGAMPPTKKRVSDTSYGTAKNGAEMQIILSEKESQVCDLLEKVSDYIAKGRPDLPRIEPRIAGGWVRDKLLGKECHDLDVAVNSMMGYEFAQYVNEYLQINGVPTRSIAKISSNPDKSKHLETATTKLFDLEVDFANLRTEVYDGNSRIPAMIAFGTPTDDAYRRDITINSLFYNVNSKRVEDFTEKGLHDLQHGLVRTPLAPFETFRDDPLRVLRCVRFASRFNFELVPELVDSVQNQTIKEALESKISRERIGIEVEKMITGPSPLHALQMLHHLNLYSVVFSPPAAITSGIVREPVLAVRAVGAVQWLSQQGIGNLHPKSAEERRLLNLGSALMPYLGVSVEVKRRPAPAVQMVLRDAVKFSNNDMNHAATVFRGVPMFQRVANNDSVSRSELGMVIREMGNLWQVSLKLSLVKELLHAHEDIPWETPELSGALESDICKKYNALIEKAERYGITECYRWKTILDGKRIASVLGINPGPGMADLVRQTMIWQLQHPSGTAEECEEMIKSYWQQQQ